MVVRVLESPTGAPPMHGAPNPYQSRGVAVEATPAEASTLDPDLISEAFLVPPHS